MSSVAGTTRDAIDTEFESDGERYAIIDTAGMRKREKFTKKLKNTVCSGH